MLNKLIISISVQGAGHNKLIIRNPLLRDGYNKLITGISVQRDGYNKLIKGTPEQRVAYNKFNEDNPVDGDPYNKLIEVFYPVAMLLINVTYRTVRITPGVRKKLLMPSRARSNLCYLTCASFLVINSFKRLSTDCFVPHSDACAAFSLFFSTPVLFFTNIIFISVSPVKNTCKGTKAAQLYSF